MLEDKSVYCVAYLRRELGQKQGVALVTRGRRHVGAEIGRHLDVVEGVAEGCCGGGGRKEEFLETKRGLPRLGGIREL